jgi:outer membrane protein with beta-barrel domain
MKKTLLIIILLALPAPALAQRVPATDSAAVSGEVGVFLPRQDGMKAGPTAEGFYEYYFEPRTSVRFGLGWAKPKFEGSGDDSIRYIRVPVDVVYNWEGGAVHPFVGAGIGVYFLQQKHNGDNVGDSDTKLGGTIFGGVELFTARRTSLKLEARYHLVQNARTNPDGLALTVGLKQYF